MRLMARMLLAVIVLGIAIGPLLAHDETYKGTVVSVETAKLQVKVIDEKTKKESSMTFTITAKTKVLRGEKVVSFAEAQIQKDERIAVTVNHDVSMTDATVVRVAVRLALQVGQAQAPTRGTLDFLVQSVASPAAAPSGEPQMSVSNRGVLLSWIERATTRSISEVAC